MAAPTTWVAGIRPVSVIVRMGSRNETNPWLLKLIVVSIFLPDEVGLRVSGLWFSGSRTIFLLLVPVLFIRFARKLITGHYRFVFSDLFVIVTGIWMIYAISRIDGFQSALTHAGPLALDFCVGYLVTRVLLSGHGQAIALSKFLCSTIAVVGLLGLMDTLSGRYLTHSLVRAVLGGPDMGNSGYRLGLLRATSTLPHPILFGFVSSIGIFLASSIKMRARRFAIIGCGVGAFIALSSAPFQAIIIGGALLAYNRVSTGVRFRWAGLIGLAAAGIIMILLVVDRPFAFIFNHLVFDTESAYFRLWTWEIAGAALDQSPFLGLGFIPPDFYEIPATVDSVWLEMALMFGIPGSILIAVSMIGGTSLSTNGPGAHLTKAESQLGTTLGIVICLAIVVGFTVHFFGAPWVLIPFLVGIRAHLGELGRISAKT